MPQLIAAGLVFFIGIAIVAAVGYVFFMFILPISLLCAVGYFAYRAFKMHLAHQGRNISEFLPAMPAWARIPDELREYGGFFICFIVGCFGLMLPGIMVGHGEAIAAISVITTVFIFSWGLPLAFYVVLNDTTIGNGWRFPILAFIFCFAFSLAGHIHPLVFLFLAALTGGYGWWWYEHHPYLLMRAAHARCVQLQSAAHLIDTQEFIATFRADYSKRWGFEPSPPIMQAAEEIYAANCVHGIPTLPALPPFKPAYTPDENHVHLFEGMANLYRDLPAQQEALASGITRALNAYTQAIPHSKEPSVFTVTAAEMIDNLPDLVRTLGTSLPADFSTRSAYEHNREAISQRSLGVKAYEAGERIEPEAFAHV